MQQSQKCYDIVSTALSRVRNRNGGEMSEQNMCWNISPLISESYCFPIHNILTEYQEAYIQCPGKLLNDIASP